MCRLYDRITAPTEAGGLEGCRRALPAPATGDVLDVLEIGGRTGVDAAPVPPKVGSLTVTEPEAPMRERIARRLAEGGIAGVAVVAPSAAG